MGADRVNRRHMDMPFGDDDAFGQFNCPFWADKRASRRAFYVAGLADHTLDSEPAGIGYRDLYLRLLPAGTKDDNLLESAFWSRYSKPFFAGLLTVPA